MAQSKDRSRGFNIVGFGASVGILLLPKCPLCWITYATIFGSLGLGFVASTFSYYVVFTLMIALALGALAYKAKSRHGYVPFLVGCGASLLILLGKTVMENQFLFYAGAGLFMIAGLWNSIPVRRKSSCHYRMREILSQ